jgi:broad specificity phosphatase PhoE
MSTIVFLRHGQASLFSDDYDQLSDLGQQQSRLLGRYFSCKTIVFDELYVGPRKRHRDTAALAHELCGNLSAAEEMPEFDEHQVDQLVSNHLDDLGKEFPYLNDLRDTFHSAETQIDRQRAFARLFESVSVLWVTDSCPLFGIESWTAFKERVNTGIRRIINRGGRSRTVLVVTSAGTIMAAMHKALHCPDEVALGLGYRIWNCSLTAFAFTDTRFTLDRFNTMSHFDDPALWTYR